MIQYVYLAGIVAVATLLSGAASILAQVLDSKGDGILTDRFLHTVVPIIIVTIYYIIKAVDGDTLHWRHTFYLLTSILSAVGYWYIVDNVDNISMVNNISSIYIVVLVMTQSIYMLSTEVMLNDLHAFDQRIKGLCLATSFLISAHMTMNRWSATEASVAINKSKPGGAAMMANGPMHLVKRLVPGLASLFHTFEGDTYYWLTESTFLLILEFASYEFLWYSIFFNDFVNGGIFVAAQIIPVVATYTLSEKHSHFWVFLMRATPIVFASIFVWALVSDGSDSYLLSEEHFTHNGTVVYTDDNNNTYHQDYNVLDPEKGIDLTVGYSVLLALTFVGGSYHIIEREVMPGVRKKMSEGEHTT